MVQNHRWPPAQVVRSMKSFCPRMKWYMHSPLNSSLLKLKNGLWSTSGVPTNTSLWTNIKLPEKHIRYSIGCPIRGDLKYGDRRSNPDGSISLIARELEFVHPVSKKTILLHAPIPDDNLWKALAEGICRQQQDSPSGNQPNTK